MRRRAVRIVAERRAQMRFGLLVSAAEEPRHFEVPAPERAISGPLLERRIDPQDRLELLPHGLAILQPLPRAERFGQRPHVRREPEMPFGTIRLRRERLASGVDALFEERAAL